MAAGNHKAVVKKDDLPPGHVVTPSGRVSGANDPTHNYDTSPFTRGQRIRLDEALIAATRATKVRFNVYIGDLGSDPAAGADDLLPRTPDASNSVLIAVSPNQRAIEIRSGAGAARVTDKVCQLGVTAAKSALSEGDLADGVLSAVNVISAALTSP